jgi:phosphoesterase RecJ-like protein
MLTIQQAVTMLKEQDDFSILLHAYPDGDAVGSGYALCYALRKLGKRANVICTHTIPKSYFFLTDGYEPQEFTPKTIVAVDVASPKLLGDLQAEYENNVLLCIDHHATNSGYAKHTLLDASSASNTEIILQVIEAMGVEVDAYIANCIYTGISTDTGCFRHSNTTPQCHLTTAQMMAKGADVELVNRYMFDTKSRSRIAIEKSILDSLEFFCEGSVAFITVTKQMREEAGIADGELEGITSIPRSVEGVQIGCTLRETDSGTYKVSIRSRSGLNAAEICAKFGGGGHPCAAGCAFTCSLEEVKAALLTECQKALEDAQ